MCNFTKKDPKMWVKKKKKKKKNWGTPSTSHFFGSLGVPEHKKNGEHALSVAKLSCRPNQYLIFYAIFSLHFKPLPIAQECPT